MNKYIFKVRIDAMPESLYWELVIWNDSAEAVADYLAECGYTEVIDITP